MVMYYDAVAPMEYSTGQVPRTRGTPLLLESPNDVLLGIVIGFAVGTLLWTATGRSFVKKSYEKGRSRVYKRVESW